VPLIASIGLFIAMEEIFRLIFGAQGISFDVPPMEGAVAIAGMHLKVAHIATFFVSIVLISALGLLAARTRTGVAWRATVTDPQMAESFGVNIQQVRLLNFFVGSALAAVAGVMVAVDNNLIEPTSGAVPAYKALAIIVLGGLGSMRGTLIACFALGVIEGYGTIYLGQLMDRDAIAFAFLIVVLMVRPQGLFARS
jgi:branched-chain amino acid transport system permease protein